MLLENFGVLNRVRARDVQQHIPIGIRVQYPSPPTPNTNPQRGTDKDHLNFFRDPVAYSRNV